LFPDQGILVTGVDKTVMRSVRQSLYIPFEYQDGLEYETLEDGKTLDGVSSIFQDSEEQLITEAIYDPKNIISLNQLRI